MGLTKGQLQRLDLSGQGRVEVSGATQLVKQRIARARIPRQRPEHVQALDVAAALRAPGLT